MGLHDIDRVHVIAEAENVNYTGGVKGLRDMIGNDKVAGLWTWSRGDGNYGPFIQATCRFLWVLVCCFSDRLLVVAGPYTKAGELWQTVNCRVLAAWANDTSRTEEELFLETVSKDWTLSASDAATLRKIALAAERATLLGRYVGPYDRVNVPFSPGDHQHGDFKIPAGGLRDYATSGPELSVMKWLVG